MNNYIHPGNTLTLVAPYEVNDGDCVHIGAIFGVAKSWACLGEAVEIVTTVVFDVKKCPEEIWEVGEKLYWDSKDRKITNVVSGNHFVGLVIDPVSRQSNAFGRIKIFGLAQ